MIFVDALCPTCHQLFRYLTGTIPYCPHCRKVKVIKPETSLEPSNLSIPSTTSSTYKKQVKR